MNITDMLLTPGSEHGRTCEVLYPKGVVVHYVANPGSSAEANRNWFESGADSAHTSAHYIVGLEGEILRLIPEDERAQHAGAAYGETWKVQAALNNSTYLGVETCHPDESGRFCVNTYASLVKLCAYLCGKYAWDPLTQVLRHFDVTGKLCPLWYVNYPEDWDVFRRDVAAEAAASDWAEEAWNWAVRKGITDGERPREYATREETAAMIWRYAASRLA